MATALPKVTEGQPDLGRLSARLLGQLSQVAALVPELANYRDAVQEVYAKAEAAGGGSRYLQRIHGDYHLGQVLRVSDRWLVIDFEGEPVRSLEERRRLASPLQDVAGMLRSFDYAAFQPLVVADSDLAATDGRATAWIEANRSAFLESYREVAGDAGWLAGDHELLLRALELDKAVYEVMYEARHRPSWLPIPLGGIRRLLGVTP